MIRPARAADAAALSDLAFRSKAVWGYSDEFMEACRAELTVSAGDLDAHPAFVVERDGRPVAFYLLKALSPDTVDLDLLYVDPAHLKQGLGRSLVAHAKDAARDRGHRRMVVQADPHAEAFYAACGGQRIGTQPSGSIPGRELPLLELDLAKP
jgi:GNAT superfamily N-acetyltransferase